MRLIDKDGFFLIERFMNNQILGVSSANMAFYSLTHMQDFFLYILTEKICTIHITLLDICSMLSTSNFYILI